MNGSVKISRRAFTGGLALLGLGGNWRWRKALPDLARTPKVLPPSCPAKSSYFRPITARIRNFASSGGT